MAEFAKDRYGQMLSEFCSQDLVAFIREQREAVELPSKTVQRDTVVCGA